jgi:hypothetical protein
MRPWAGLALVAVALALAASASAETYKWRVSGSVTGTYSSSHSWVSCEFDDPDGVASIQEHVDVRAKLRPRASSSYEPGDLLFGTSLRFVAGGGWHLSGTYTPRGDPLTGEIVCGARLPVGCGGAVALERGTTLSVTAVKRGRSFVAGYQFGHFYGASPSESPLGVCTAGGGDPQLGEQVNGLFGPAFGSENTRSRIEFPVARLTRGESFSVTGTPAFPDPDACASEYLTACTQSGRFVWKLTFEPKGGLTADAGGPYTVLRGRRLRLDGSRSTPRGRIDSYRWTFERAAPSDPPPPLGPPVVAGLIPQARAAQDAGCRPDHGGKQGKAPTVLPLCTIKAKLTVRDGGETDSDTTTITVKPRDWQTPVKYLNPERYTRWGQPQHGSPDGSTFGLNVPGCDGAARTTRDSYFCPLPDGDTWHGEAYALDIVDDPKGPHDGHWYVKPRPKFEIRRRELVNAYLYAGAGVPAGSRAPKEFYAANRDAGFPIDDFIRYVKKHEGAGQGVPRSGHTQAIVDAIRGEPDANDPQRVIESVVEPSERAARREADKRLRGAGERVCLNTRDPLAGPWTGDNPVAWDPTFRDFRPLEGADFQGDPRDCAGS